MRLSLFLVFSIGLHVLALLVSGLNAGARMPAPRPLTVELPLPDLKDAAPDEVLPLADQLSTHPVESPPAPPPPQMAPAPDSATRPRQQTKSATRQAQSRLMERLLYPPQAVSQGLEGEVLVLLSLDAAGRVVNASVARSSGHALLDNAALDAARAIGVVLGQSGELLLPVEFSLD